MDKHKAQDADSLCTHKLGNKDTLAPFDDEAYTISDFSDEYDDDEMVGYFQVQDHIICFKVRPNWRTRTFAWLLGISWTDL